MTFDQIHEQLYAVRWEDEEDNEVGRLFDLWHDVAYLKTFFKKYETVITDYFQTTVNDAITKTLRDASVFEDALYDLADNADLDSFFQPLGYADLDIYCLQRNKAKNKTHINHNGWLRIYALKLDTGEYVITGGAIKMAQKMQDTEETLLELTKINKCRTYLFSERINDAAGLDDLIAEN